MFELKLENKDSKIVNLNDGERYEVITASGLNPPAASIFTSKSPNRKGLKYNGSTINERSIVIQIKLLGNVEENRNALYEWADPEEYAKIHYTNGIKKVYCEGHVEVCDVDPFSDNEVMNVEILCENPYWKDMQEIVIEISSIAKEFTVPFAIAKEREIRVSSKMPKGEITSKTESVYATDDSTTVLMNEGVPLSTLKESNTTSFFNAGAETGAQFVIRCIEPIDSFMIYDAEDTTRRFRIEYPCDDGWSVIIDTEGSPKTVKAIKPDGTSVSILRYVKGVPTWFQLKKGFNAFGFLANEGAAEIELSVWFTNKYLGI